MALGEPLLSERKEGESEATRSAPVGRRYLCLLTAGAFCLYVLLGTLERVSFARMAHAMPDGVLLMHTLLALMSLCVFTALQLARSQTLAHPLDAAPQTLHLPDAISIAFLDVLHSILALMGATMVPGVLQALLLQLTVPAVALFALLLPPHTHVADVHTAEADDGRYAYTSKSAGRSLRARMLRMIYHYSPAEIAHMLFRSPRTYQALAAVLIAAAIALIIITPAPTVTAATQWLGWLPLAEQQLPQPQTKLLAPPRGDTMPNPGDYRPGGGAGDAGAPEDVGATWLAADGQLLFAVSTVVSALASAHKRQCLSRRPVDLLVFNTSLSALHLFMGLLVAPPLLLLLDRRPIKDTLVTLARGLRCFMSGMNPNICGDSRNDFGTPSLLIFFIASSAWSGASFGLLRLGGDVPIAIGSALLLPMTLLAFVHPLPLPYGWAAPPEPLWEPHARLALLLIIAVSMYHYASVGSLKRRAASITSAASSSPRNSRTSPRHLDPET